MIPFIRGYVYNYNVNILLKFIKKIILNSILFLIRTYQFFLSFDHSFWAKFVPIRICIYHPSCSEYSYESFKKFGIVKGFILSISRVIRCNPLSKGGYDPVPDKHPIKK